ncbi:CBM96 family carbohydrate-binding protein [Vallitalea maricola]|uniref:Uncharacterized protein n=1 Tax=Vallitalea maricola TaxID=3074433 RepID=A0ACB5UG82_9FIRM|nr:hypothetical protein AN2V17_11840 [Vallitalea sp. AN17-2]
MSKKTVRRFVSYCMMAAIALSSIMIDTPVVIKAATGTTYYVDSLNGDDSQSGTNEASAWKTLDKVNSTTFQSGDKILFKAGCVWNGQLWLKGSGAEGNPIIVDKYGVGDKPIINGQGTVTPTLVSGAVMIVNDEYWEINNLEVTNYHSTEKSVRCGILIYNGGGGTKNHIRINNCYVHDVNSDKDGSKISGGIIVYSSKQKIDGVNTSVTSGFNDVVIENNHVKNVAIEGIRNKTQDGTNYPKVNRNIVIRNNFVEEVLGDGIVLAETISGGLVENNVVKNHCNTNVGNRNYAGCWVFTSHDAVFQFNEVYGGRYGYNDGEAFDIDLYCDGTIYQYNYSHDNNGGFCLFMNGSTNSVFRYNISVNDGNGNEIFHYGPSSPSEAPMIYNNSIYIKEGISTRIFNTWGTGRVMKFYNNIIESHGTITKFSKDQVTGEFYNNCFYPSTIDDINGPTSHLGLITENPGFVNPGYEGLGLSAGEAYKIKSDSPCINAGVKITNNGGKDYFGNTLYNSTPDIGAHEYEGQVPPPEQGPEGVFYPLQDAYVRDGSYADNNFGYDTGLTVKKDATSYNRKAYLLFDFNNYTKKNIEEAVIRLYVSHVNGDPTRTIKVYGVNEENWDESNITWNNAPTQGSYITSFEVSNESNKWYEFNITDFAKDNMVDKKLALVLVNEGSISSQGDVTFGSKDSWYYQPELVITDSVTAKINPNEDAYVRDGNYADQNYGNDEGLMVKSDAASYRRKSYMLFDYQVYNKQNVSKAVVKLFVTNVNTDPLRTVKVYGINDENWDESNLTWNNSPASGTYITSFEVTNELNRSYTIDITDYVNANMGDKRISLVFVNEDMDTSRNDVTFASKEAIDNGPILLLTE